MTTTNPVPSRDPSDLLFNAGKLDEVVSGSNATYTDRLGISRRTMAGIDAAADVVLGGLGYAPPVAYASGIALTLTTQTVEYAGEMYAPKVANLPFTTSGSFETAKFRLIQGVASADLASGGGAAMVGYTPAGTGAVPTTVQSKLRETVSVKDFGATAGSGNLATSLQAAHDALGADGGTIYIPGAATNYPMSSTAAFTKPIRLVGDGWYSSEILANTASVTLITTTSKLEVEGIHFTSLTSARGNSTAIRTLAAAANHSYTLLRNCYFDGQSRCYWSERTNALYVDGCIFGAISGYDLYLENLTNPDEGDSFISNSTFSGDATTICIYVPSTSGINVTGCKFNGAVVGHVLVDAGATAVGNYLFSNNSFEGHTGYAVKLRASGGTLTKALITGNQFSSLSAEHVLVAAGSQNIAITGNTFNSTSSASGRGITVEAGTHDTTITGNAFHQILEGVICASSATLGITMSGNRFAADVTAVFAGDDGQNFGSYGSSREICVARYFQEGAGTLTAVYKFQGSGTLEIMVYGLAQSAGWVNYARKVAILQTTTTNDINGAVAQGSAITVALNVVSGYLEVQVAKSAGSIFTGYVEVIARGQISHVSKV